MSDPWLAELPCAIGFMFGYAVGKIVAYWHVRNL